MTTHWPIYQLVEEEMLTTKIEDEVSEWIVLWLKFILPKIQELEPTWISVDDRLPEECKEVLILISYWHIQKWHIDWSDWFKYRDKFRMEYSETPTHWMELPKIPNNN